MDTKAYIDSGILELYVAGTLSEKENQEVNNLMMEHPEILQEVLEIEASIIKLTSAVAPSTNKNKIFKAVKDHVGFGRKSKVIPMSKPKYNWITYTGWAAAVILGTGMFWLISQNKQLQSDIQIAETQQELLEIQIE